MKITNKYRGKRINQFIYALLLFTVFALVLRFFNLNWGAPFYFHPDERQNIAYPILESHHPLMYDQENFDINPFPLAVIKNIYNSYTFLSPDSTRDPVHVIIVISRIISASLSIGISLILYFFTAAYFSKRAAILAFILSIFSTGLIQYAHFGTIELWEAFLLLLVLFILTKLIHKWSLYSLVSLGVAFSLALSTKFLTLFFIPTLIFGFGILIVNVLRKKGSFRKKIRLILFSLLLVFLSALLTTAFFFPQVLIYPEQIRGSLMFESSVARGTLKVFFTEGFTNTTPIIYHLFRVFPFILNPALTILLPFSLLFLGIFGIKNRNFPAMLVTLSFLSLFISQGILYVKWTRYMIPTLPFAYIALAVFISHIDLWLEKRTKRNTPMASITLISLSVLFSLSFFYTAYMNEHSTVQALKQVQHALPKETRGISEPFDLGVTPFHAYYTDIFLFNFYDLDNGNAPYQSLEAELENTSFVLLPSPRIVRSRINNPHVFPKGFRFYNSLFDTNQYTLLYQTPCNILCKIAYLGDPIYRLEETATVFDRPTVFIFTKNAEEKNTNN